MCCTDHAEEMQNIYYSVIKACDDSARKCIPSTRGHTGGKRLTGWYDHGEEHHQLALHWHYCWKIEGRPHNGHTSDMRRKTRAKYHLAVRQAKKNKNKISSDKMAIAISNNCSRDLLSETRKIRSARGRGLMCVDNEIEDTVVANILNTKYNNLYNSVPYDEVEINNIIDKIQRCIQQYKDKVYDINVDDVKKAVKHLKLLKGDGEEGLFSDNIIHAPHILHVFICMLFKALFRWLLVQ